MHADRLAKGQLKNNPKIKKESKQGSWLANRHFIPFTLVLAFGPFRATSELFAVVNKKRTMELWEVDILWQVLEKCVFWGIWKYHVQKLWESTRTLQIGRTYQQDHKERKRERKREREKQKEKRTILGEHIGKCGFNSSSTFTIYIGFQKGRCMPIIHTLTHINCI